MRLLLCSLILAQGILAVDFTKFQNLTPVFEDFLQKSQNQSDEKRVELFKKLVVPSHPAFYQRRFKRWQENNKNVDTRILENLNELATQQKRYSRMLKTAKSELESAAISFEKVFPDMKWDFPIYLLHSLGEMNGGTRTLDGKFQLIFGIDGITLFQTTDNNEPFFHHELFHVYHHQKDSFHGNGLYSALWNEGLATYVSHAMNPEAVSSEIFMNSNLEKKCLQKYDFLLADIRSRLNSRSDQDYEMYFKMDSDHKMVPERAGYFLGYLVLKEIGKTHSLKAMAEMNEKTALKHIRKALAHLKKLKASDLQLFPKQASP